jgi:hypothetical protein
MADRRPLRNKTKFSDMTPEQQDNVKQKLREHVLPKIADGVNMSAESRERFQSHIKEKYGQEIDFRTTGQKMMSGALNTVAGIGAIHEVSNQAEALINTGSLSTGGMAGSFFGKASKMITGSSSSAFQKWGTGAAVGLGLAGAAGELMKDQKSDIRRPGEIIKDAGVGALKTAGAAVAIGGVAELISRNKEGLQSGFTKLLSNAAKNPV